jgi:hypothetical protein
MPNISVQDRTIRELKAQAESFRQNAIAIERTIEIMKAGTPTVEPTARKASAATTTTAAPTKRARRRNAKRERIAAPTSGKRKPGRPKGSRNKPKPAITDSTPASAPAPEATETVQAQGNDGTESWAGNP